MSTVEAVVWARGVARGAHAALRGSRERHVAPGHDELGGAGPGPRRPRRTGRLGPGLGFHRPAAGTTFLYTWMNCGSSPEANAVVVFDLQKRVQVSNASVLSGVQSPWNLSGPV